MKEIEYGPYPLSITNGLDFYKPTMSQLAYEKTPKTEVTFTFKNRGKQRLLDYISLSDLQEKFDLIRQNGWNKDELEYLNSLNDDEGNNLFSDDYTTYLADGELPVVKVSYDESNDDLEIHTTGDWPLVTFWETVIMSEVNESYFENFMIKNHLDPFNIYEEGDKRLSSKISFLQQNPDIKFADFGSRRHFSFRWQKHVIERLLEECPENFIGTSNVGLAKKFGIKPIGTFAHEMPMIYSAVAENNHENIRLSHGKMLDDWYEKYGKKLSVALTDTFTTDFFFEDFGEERAILWNGLRQDSGDPIEFGKKAIRFYENHGIDPATKTIVFSDGLSIEDIEKIYNYFKGHFKMIFGWGTSLTNDMGIKPLNIVMKATSVDGTGTVKLSDVDGKHTGSLENIERYRNEFL